ALGELLPRLATDAWFVHVVHQGDTQIALVGDDKKPLDGGTCWRLIRSLRPGPVTLELNTRPAVADPGGGKKTAPHTVTLPGWRRRYTDPSTGVIDTAYRPGELTQSLCSPWTHDFRDCACSYWASNHPDIVKPAIPLGARTQPGGLPADWQHDIDIDWLRNPDFPDLQAEALPTQDANRPFEISYYQINQEWQGLAVVLERRETNGLYVPRSQMRDGAAPFDNDEELRQRVTELAGLEHLVALLYLYAHFSVISPEQAKDIAVGGKWRTLVKDVTYMRATLMDVAIGEMQHLRAVNLLLWQLDERANRPNQPAVQPPATRLPQPDQSPSPPAKLAPLTLDTVNQFIDIERSSAYIDGQYSRVTATLRGAGYPPRLYELASTIADEGEEHFLRFSRIKNLIETTYSAADHPVYLRRIDEGKAKDAKVVEALTTYHKILDALVIGYRRGDVDNQKMLIEARNDMFTLKEQAERLAQNNIGIPFLPATTN
ncbi:MAG: ferritin-like domain-containing protein, partial [Mycobacterium sp.]